jgi:hypothetical protein
MHQESTLQRIEGSLTPSAGRIAVCNDNSPRIASIDVLRGLVIAVMALDHTRDFFGASDFNPRDVTEPAPFLTRWITHLCAPTFILLAGLSAFLYGRGKTKKELSHFLLIWLIAIESVPCQAVPALTQPAPPSRVDLTLGVYFHHCAIAMSCKQLARSGLFLANSGRVCMGENVVSPKRARRINALMLTCGQYDGSGDFAYRVGLPGKSGVGGGLLAIVPDFASVAVWSPALNIQGNSLMGTFVLERLAEEAGWSIF